MVRCGVGGVWMYRCRRADGDKGDSDVDVRKRYIPRFGKFPSTWVHLTQGCRTDGTDPVFMIRTSVR